MSGLSITYTHCQRGCNLVLTVLLVGNLGAVAAWGQLVPDETLGASSSVVVPNVTINGAAATQIEGGAIQGNNLFHSFQDFNVGVGERVYFANPVGIDTILNRVTGTSASTIQGLLGVNGSADLFLLNPNGIVFGPAAQLDVRGAFTASTGEGITFTDGAVFSAVDPAGSMLSVDVPLGVQFGSQVAGDITVQGTLVSGQDLTLSGHQLTIQGGLQARGDLTLQAQGEISGVGSDAPISVDLITDGGDVSLIGSDILLSITNIYTVTTSAQGDAGNLTIMATGDPAAGQGRVDLSLSNLVTSSQGLGQSGAIMITAPASLTLEASTISSALAMTGVGQGGDIIINTGNLELSSASAISSTTLGIGDSGPITITADRVLMADASSISSRVGFGAVGDSSGLTLTTSSLEVNNQSQISTTTFGQGTSGLLTINASENILLSGPESLIDSGVAISSNGSSLGIVINTNELTILDGAIVAAGTQSSGDAGPIVINTTGRILVDGLNSGIGSQVLEGSTGNSNGITITTSNLTVSNGGEVGANTLGQGNSGPVTVIADDSIVVQGQGAAIRSDVGSEDITRAIGNSGGLNLTTGSLTVTEGGVISASTFGRGKAGQIVITAVDTTVEGTASDGSSSLIQSRVQPDARGASGGLDITTDRLLIANQGQVSASTFGSGNAGLVRVNAADAITITGHDSSLASVVREGAMGNSQGLDITTGDLTLTEGGVIAAGTLGLGQAGPITIQASGVVLMEGPGSVITSQVGEEAIGQSGRIDIVADSLTLLDGAAILAYTNGRGAAGDLTISTANDVNLQGQALILVSSTSRSPGPAGNLTIEAKAVYLDASTLSASTASGEKGNINLSLEQALVLRNGSLISADAARQADGGNITILVPDGFVIAVPAEDSDIIATALRGNGGLISVESLYTLGFTTVVGEQGRGTLRNNGRSDISASSRLGQSGEVVVANLGFEPGQGLTELPINLIDHSSLIGQSLCEAGRNSEFTISGRGGLPASPGDGLTSQPIWEDWYIASPTLPDSSAISPTALTVVVPEPIASPLLEAQGWIEDGARQIWLVADPGSAQPQLGSMLPVNCRRGWNRDR